MFEMESFHISKQPEDTKLMSAKDEAKLNVEATGGVEPYTYQWVKHDKGLGFAVGKNSFTLRTTQLGEYSCKITDAEGQVTRSRRVTVSYGGAAPLIITQPTPRTIMDWDEFPKLRCSAVSGSGDDENLSYVWAWSGGDTGWYQLLYGGPTIVADTTGLYRCGVIDRSTGKYTESEIAVVYEEMRISNVSMKPIKGVRGYTSAKIEIEGGSPPYQVVVCKVGQYGMSTVKYTSIKSSNKSITIDGINGIDRIPVYTADKSAAFEKEVLAKYVFMVYDKYNQRCDSEVVEVTRSYY